MIADLHNKAKIVLNDAYIKAAALTAPTAHSLTPFIYTVIDSTHKTFKYILFTALLAKATEPSVDILALQATAGTSGAYDARSLCHSIIVPFETTILNRALGGSNEPYLNKPARFPRIDKGNAVRGGNDKRLLEMLCDNLPKINKADAETLLINLLFKLIAISKATTIFSEAVTGNDAVMLIDFVNELLKENCEGESLTLVVGGVYYALFGNDSRYLIDIHPVNQSGASSKEISDMDIFRNGKLLIANEIKDKAFSASDVRHAVHKARVGGLNTLFFIKGFSGKLVDSMSEKELEAEQLKNNFVLCFTSVTDWIKYLINLSEPISLGKVVEFIFNKASQLKFKEKTKRYLLETAKKFGLTE